MQRLDGPRRNMPSSEWMWRVLALIQDIFSAKTKARLKHHYQHAKASLVTVKDDAIVDPDTSCSWFEEVFPHSHRVEVDKDHKHCLHHNFDKWEDIVFPKLAIFKKAPPKMKPFKLFTLSQKI